MIHDLVADWRELSAVYEQADLLAGSALREWLAALPVNMQMFVPRLERMLAACVRAAPHIDALVQQGERVQHGRAKYRLADIGTQIAGVTGTPVGSRYPATSLARWRTASPRLVTAIA
jgi:hypothetical protein